MLKNSLFLNQINQKLIKLSSRLRKHEFNQNNQQFRHYSFNEFDPNTSRFYKKHLKFLNEQRIDNAKLSENEDETLNKLGLEKYKELFEENFRLINKEAEKKKLLNEDEESNYDYFLKTREFKEIKIEMFDELIKDDNEMRERIKKIINEFELEKYNSGEVPTELKIEDMKEILDLKEPLDIGKQFLFLFRKEFKRINFKLKRQKESIKIQENLRTKFSGLIERSGLIFDANGKPVYAKWKNTMFISFNREALRKEYERRVRDSILFGPRLVIDFGYNENEISRYSFSKISNQLLYLLADSHKAREPFHLNICNLNENAHLRHYLKQKMSYLFKKNSLINITSQSYLDIFPRKDLIYLSTCANQSLKSVDQNKVYIIGGSFDKFKCSKMALEKAKSEKIACFKFPLEDYFFFKQERTLPMNLTASILNRYLTTNDWRKAFISKIPPRKLKTPNEIEKEQVYKVKKYYSKAKYFNAINKQDEIIYANDQLEQFSDETIYDDSPIKSIYFLNDKKSNHHNLGKDVDKNEVKDLDKNVVKDVDKNEDTKLKNNSNNPKYEAIFKIEYPPNPKVKDDSRQRKYITNDERNCKNL